MSKQLIGELKEIISKKTKEDVPEIGSASSVTDDKYTEWNKVLCKIIILASFTKINQAEFWQLNIDKVINRISEHPCARKFNSFYYKVTKPFFRGRMIRFCFVHIILILIQ